MGSRTIRLVNSFANYSYGEQLKCAGMAYMAADEGDDRDAKKALKIAKNDVLGCLFRGHGILIYNKP